MTLSDKPDTDNADNECRIQTHLSLYEAAVGVIAELLRTKDYPGLDPARAQALRRAEKTIKQYHAIVEMVMHS